MKKIIIVIIGLIVLVGVILLIIKFNNSGQKNVTTNNINQIVPVTNQPIINTNSNGIPTTNATIVMKNFAFNPAEITVKKGVIVKWVNNDSASHQIAADASPVNVFTKSLNSYIMAPSQEWSFTFDAVGTFNYHCSLHPEMKGAITVIE
jgi:plastocyanin